VGHFLFTSSDTSAVGCIILASIHNAQHASFISVIG